MRRRATSATCCAGPPMQRIERHPSRWRLPADGVGAFRTEPRIRSTRMASNVCQLILDLAGPQLNRGFSRLEAVCGGMSSQDGPDRQFGTRGGFLLFALGGVAREHRPDGNCPGLSPARDPLRPPIRSFIPGIVILPPQASGTSCSTTISSPPFQQLPMLDIGQGCTYSSQWRSCCIASVDVPAPDSTPQENPMNPIVSPKPHRRADSFKSMISTPLITIEKHQMLASKAS
jgi:hypothetical protein